MRCLREILALLLNQSLKLKGRNTWRVHENKACETGVCDVAGFVAQLQNCVSLQEESTQQIKIVIFHGLVWMLF